MFDNEKEENTVAEKIDWSEVTHLEEDITPSCDGWTMNFNLIPKG